MTDIIPSVGAIIPTTTTRQDVVTKVYEGTEPGTTQVHSTVSVSYTHLTLPTILRV